MGNKVINMTSRKDDYILEVKNLKQYFPISGDEVFKAVDGVSFTIEKGKTYGLVGESGSGKTTIGRSIIRIYDPTEGEVYFEGEKISGKLTKDQKAYVSRNIQMIFQDPMASLNPHKKVIDIIAQGLDNFHLYKDKKDRERQVFEIMERVGLNKDHAYRYPHQFSGGQRQRIGIARAFIVRPKLIIADEAISALDVSVQAQVVNLMKDLQKEFGTTYLFIAHDLAMVRYISDEIGVLHKGFLLEKGQREEIFNSAAHPYTRALLSAVPYADPLLEKDRHAAHYDYESSGISYKDGTYHKISDNHYILCNDEEYEEWTG